jgi:hypothetical protein
MPHRSPMAKTTPPPKICQNQPQISEFINQSTSKDQIYRNLEGFRQGSCPKKSILQTAEELEERVPVPRLLGSEKKGGREQEVSSSRGHSSSAPSASGGQDCSHMWLGPRVASRVLASSLLQSRARRLDLLRLPSRCPWPHGSVRSPSRRGRLLATGLQARR